MIRHSLLGLFVIALASCGSPPPPEVPEAPASEQADVLEEPATPPAAADPSEPEVTPPPPEEKEEVPEVKAAEAPAPEPPSDVPGANMHVGRITADGTTVQDIACRTEGGGLGGLFGTLAIGKPFADRKGQLGRCVKASHKTRVRWTAVGGKMTDVKVISGDDPVNACIERALSGAPATVAGTCAASFEIVK